MEELGYIFAGLIEKYSRIGLYYCRMKELQKWRGFKEKYLICEVHYNQFFVNPQFYESLVGSSETIQQENQQISQLIIDLNSQIKQICQYLKDQRNELEELKKQLQGSHEGIIVMQNLYEKVYQSNQVLTEQWNSRFASQQKRIDTIIEIAKAEHVSLLNDIDLLIQNNSRFFLDNLMVYSPWEWLNGRNKVIVKFVETLVQNNYATDILSLKKFFKAVVIVNSIYRAQHRKYVSEIHLAASAIKYIVARSKIVINIDNYITSCGSYNRFLKWQNELSKQKELLPEGLLFLAFDNEQKGQKNYLDREFNMVTYHIVTSFVAFNMSLENKIQYTNSSWAYDSLSKSQFDKIFSVNTQMQEVINEELYSYLSGILELLSEEKLSSTNAIDSFVA
ncbi:10606_t:CDS:2 [Scutellospora calospora]|uniref:10606_t:CDS:1 n=1 Tax=Scutellospora calospora TaxID=85575 RepID=A0ACA9L143_9GLOM|nr:10606_t:CDS:2 [Scutellospora calospora]